MHRAWRRSTTIYESPTRAGDVKIVSSEPGVAGMSRGVELMHMGGEVGSVLAKIAAEFEARLTA
jgi:hypothetical protein